jgi:hypothetical protein
MKHGIGLLILVVAMAGCKGPCAKNLPPAEMMMRPGPGVGGPGPGVFVYQPGQPMPGQASQVYFAGPEGMNIAWDVSGMGGFDSQPLVCPGRYNFPQGAIYRLKLSNIPGRPGVELYPTLEVAHAMPRTQAFLAHSAIPAQFTEEDFDQVLSGNFVTKVIYLPDQEYQELAVAGVETLVSTRLDPGVDPIVEADNRGSILAIVRLGNKDLQIPGEVAEQGGMVPGPGPMAGGPGCPGNGMMPAGYVSGVSGPQYGMPMCGTPIGLPGPPHVPLGIPAGLQGHTMVNHTSTHMPAPTQHVRVDVKQTPGFSYPKPANHAVIVENNNASPAAYRQPFGSRHVRLGPDGTACETGAPCADGATADGAGESE